MRVRDLLRAGLVPFRRQKLRSILTTLGVTIGIATLVASVSVGVGVRRIIDDGFRRQNTLREIQIYPGYQPISDELTGLPPEAIRVEGEVSAERRQRLQRHLAQQWRSRQSPPMAKPLTPQRLKELAAMPHVVNVEPSLQQNARSVLQGRVADAECVALTRHEESLPELLIAGRSPEAANEVVVHEFLLYRLGIHDDHAVTATVGQSLTIEFSGTRQRRPELLLTLFNADATKITEAEINVLAKARDLLPKAIDDMPLSQEEKSLLRQTLGRQKANDPAEKIYPTVRRACTIVGVFRSRTKEEDRLPNVPGHGVRGEVIFAKQHAMAFFSLAPRRAEEGFQSAVLTVDDDQHLKEVCDQLKREGHQFFAVGLFLQTAKKNALLIGFTMDFVALIALGVAFIGIMNTMFTAVLERTKEIGVMKSVGAKDRQILTMFLVEGAMIGMLGGGLGLLIGWLVSFPGDHVALDIIREQEPNMPPVKSVFAYPWWLLVGAPSFAVLVTTLAGVLPARRAAQIEPVVALRHE